jgi:hypothetical protein
MGQQGSATQARMPSRRQSNKDSLSPIAKTESHIYNAAIKRWIQPPKGENMKITNPWPNRPMTRITCKTPNGEVMCTSSTRGPLEVPDATTEALLEPVANGRPNAAVVGPPRIWSNQWGVMEVEDHVKKMKMEKDEAAMKERKRAAKEEKARKARDIQKVDKERTPDKVVKPAVPSFKKD